MKTKSCFLIWMTALSCVTLQADTLSYTVTPGGTDLYQFTLSNTGATGGTLFDLFVALPTDISNVLTSTIGTPTGWGDPTGGILSSGPNQSPSTSFVEWTADFNGAYNIPIGSSLAGFSFETLQPITGPIQFALNDSTTLQTAIQGGVVPEPSMLSMLLLSVLALSVGGLRGRRKFRTR